ncbi:hypothetical protein AAFN86_28650 [Roseomonas sp. CAU 1739]
MRRERIARAGRDEGALTSQTNAYANSGQQSQSYGPEWSLADRSGQFAAPRCRRGSILIRISLSLGLQDIVEVVGFATGHTFVGRLGQLPRILFEGIKRLSFLTHRQMRVSRDIAGRLKVGGRLLSLLTRV